MELVLKTSEQKCFVGSNPTASAKNEEVQARKPRPGSGFSSLYLDNQSASRLATILMALTQLNVSRLHR